MITKPINANIRPANLNCFVLIKFNIFNIFFIFDGNKAYNTPSIKKKRPKAMINSFIKRLFCLRLYVSKKFKKFTIRRQNQGSLSTD